MLPQTLPDWAHEDCVVCGIAFFVPGTFQKHKKEQGQKAPFYCPNGHQLTYTKSEADRLREQLAAKEAELARERQRIEDRDRIIGCRDRSLSAARGQVTKIKNRVSHGVCPCCNRTFQNVMRHMATKHPDWKGQELG